MNQSSITVGSDGRSRCFWCGNDPLYQRYHDEEWGRPLLSHAALFEKLCLEAFQAGLSWITVLRKREAFRAAFHAFDFQKVAAMNHRDVERLMQNPGIIRNRQKIQAVIHNAKIMQEEPGSLKSLIWSHVPPASERPSAVTRQTLLEMPQTPTSRKLARALKKQGFKFIGPTSAYAFMQAAGVVNDHMDECWVRDEVEALQAPLRV